MRQLGVDHWPTRRSARCGRTADAVQGSPMTQSFALALSSQHLIAHQPWLVAASPAKPSGVSFGRSAYGL